jgi:hypothetical protein
LVSNDETKQKTEQLKQKTMQTKRKRLNPIFMAMLLTVLMTAGSVYAEGTEMHAVPGLENSAESRLEVENWMVSENYWYHPQPAFIVGYAEEKKLGLEPWMLSESQFAGYEIPRVEDQKMKVENWMVDRNIWNG